MTPPPSVGSDGIKTLIWQETRCGNNLAGSDSNLCKDSLLTGHSQSVSSQSVCRRFYHRWLAVHGTDLPLLHRLDFSMSFSTVCSFYGTTAKANLGRRPRLSLTINQVTLLNKEWFIRTLLLKAVPTHPEPSLCYWGEAAGRATGSDQTGQMQSVLQTQPSPTRHNECTENKPNQTTEWWANSLFLTWNADTG